MSKGKSSQYDLWINPDKRLQAMIDDYRAHCEAGEGESPDALVVLRQIEEYADAIVEDVQRKTGRYYVRIHLGDDLMLKTRIKLKPEFMTGPKAVALAAYLLKVLGPETFHEFFRLRDADEPAPDETT